ncbi:MAG TPA: type II toxin-antitoxin system PemK/MazF family toxin [Actinomycetota bacterium]|nr:type II toxin-antitoxin system PemK/MazF family toxin [Actinomycetota bacterium]
MRSGTIYSQGDLILVPFPFTDLSATKRRPAVVVSPDHFHRTADDVVLVAVTAQPSAAPSEMDLGLVQSDLALGRIPRPSTVKLAKLFTMHQRLIAKRIGRLRQPKLTEALDRLRWFFAGEPRLVVREPSAPTFPRPAAPRRRSRDRGARTVTGTR